MKQTCHIVFLAAWYPDDQDPMFGLFIQRHAQLLANAGYCIHVITPSYRKEKGNGIFTHVTSGLRVTHVNITYQTKWFKWLGFAIAMRKAYRDSINKYGKPAVNHVHILTRMGMVALFAKIFHGVPFVITEHWSRYFDIPGTYRNFIRKWLTRYICNHSKACSAVSHKLAHAMQNHRLGRKKPWTIINNTVDDHIFSVPAVPSGNRLVKFLNVSCFEDRSKNITGLLYACKFLRDNGVSFHCYLVGQGEDEATLRKLASDLNLNQSVIFTGLLGQHEVAKLMQECHFYVQPSHYENVPVVISEALMCGLPVLATNVGAVSEMISEQDGYLVKPASNEELFAAIKLMCDQYTAFDRIQIRERALKKYSGKAILGQFEQLYQLAGI